MIIVCLANSRKHSGRCIAGKEFADGRAGGWIRALGGRQRFENGEYPKLLDVIQIPVTRAAPVECQTENWEVDSASWWVWKGLVRWEDVREMADAAPGDLWINGFSGTRGLNDRFPVDRARELSGSLLLIAAAGVVLRVGSEGPGERRRVRGGFLHNARSYMLAVTDPEVEAAFLARPDGEYPILEECLLTLSVSAPFEGYRYKLIAAVIRDAPG